LPTTIHQAGHDIFPFADAMVAASRQGGNMTGATLTSADRIVAGAAALYFAYRLWCGWGEGIIYGDGDMDVHADKHPAAFVLTAVTIIIVIALCASIALGASVIDLAAMVAWLWKV
jgi:hypothetical protein